MSNIALPGEETARIQVGLAYGEGRAVVMLQAGGPPIQIDGASSVALGMELIKLGTVATLTADSLKDLASKLESRIVMPAGIVQQ